MLLLFKEEMLKSCGNTQCNPMSDLRMGYPHDISALGIGHLSFSPQHLTEVLQLGHLLSALSEADALREGTTGVPVRLCPQGRVLIKQWEDGGTQHRIRGGADLDLCQRMDPL